MAYDIPADVEVGGPGHVQHHNELAAAVNDLSLQVGVADFDGLPAGLTITVWYDGGWPPRPTALPKIVCVWCSVDYQGIPPTALSGIDFLRVMEYQPIPDPDPDPPIEAPGTTLGTYTFESDTDGALIVPSSPWSLGGSTTLFQGSTAAAVHGVMGGKIERGSNARWLQYTESTAVHTRVVDFYFRLIAITGSYYMCQLSWDNGGVATNRADWRVNADRTITMRDAQIAVASSGEDQLQTYTLYRASWKISPAGQRLRIIRMSDNELAMDISGSLANASSYRYQVGIMGGTAGTIVEYDTIRIGDDWIPAYV